MLVDSNHNVANYSSVNNITLSNNYTSTLKLMQLN